MAKIEKNSSWTGIFLFFTVLCAVMLVLAQSAQGSYAVGTGGRQVLDIYEGLCRWSIPALFLVWGMNGLEERKIAFGNNMMTLALPAFCLLVAWSTVYAIVSQLLGGDAISLGSVWNALVWAAKGNTYFHLWVLYPLIGIYLIHPVLHRFVVSASRGEVLYFLALCAVFASILPVWHVFFGDSVIVSLLQRLDIDLVLGWVGYYVAGWYLKYYTIGRVAEFLIYIFGLFGMILTLAGDQLFGGGQALWYSYSAPGVAMTAIAMCALFRYVLGISEERSRRQSAYRLGSCAFEIYLIHQLWALVAQWVGIPSLPFGPVLGIPLMAAVYCTLSFPIAWLVGKIPGLAKVA